ncbi:MAG: site-specific integrase, partial [Bacteroidota bacterium]
MKKGASSFVKIEGKKTPLGRQVLAYLNFLRVEKGVSENTGASYRSDLARYRVFLEDHLHITSAGNIKEEQVGKFLQYLTKAGLSARSVARTFSAIRGFHRFLVGEDQSDDDPTQNLKPPRRSKSLPAVLSVAEIDAMFQQPDVTKKLGVRDRAILETLYATGIRVSELINLKQSNLLFEEELILV